MIKESVMNNNYEAITARRDTSALHHTEPVLLFSVG